MFRRLMQTLACILFFAIGTVPLFGQTPDDEIQASPGTPPGIDVGGRPGVGLPPTSQLKLQSTSHAMQDVANDGKFHIVEATIPDIHAALESGDITCETLIQTYLKRIKTYSGQCVNYDKNGDGIGPDYDFFMPSGKGIILGAVNAMPNAKKVNAISTINLRPSHYSAFGFKPPDDPGPRSETDLIDNDPNMPDALEVAQALDRDYKFFHKLKPLQCIPIVIKDQMETFDLRTTDGSLTQFTNDRPPNDGTLVAKLRAAGAVIIGKSNMDEYAVGTHRSSYGGQICNPYATDRDGGSSSTGSAAAVSANLAVCGIAEESGGSIQEPGSRQGLVAMTATRGLVSRFGSWPAELIRERYGPECRTVVDTAKVLDVIRGYDRKDPITATQIGYTPDVSFDNYAHATSLKGKRIGIVREFMPNMTINDTESIRVFNEEVIPTLKAAGADLVESINPRDIANGWSSDDPTIPNMSIQDIVAEMIPTLEPSFANPNTVPSPNTTTGLLPSTLRQVFDPTVPALFPAGTDIIQKSIEMFYDPKKFPDTINLRKLANNGAGTLNQGRYGLDKMLTRRNDPRVKSVLDLSIDFDDLNHNGNKNEHLSFFSIDANTGLPTQKPRPGVSPTVGVPATPNGPALDTQGEVNHIVRQQSIREIVARILADNDLDALVYPFATLPPKILSGVPESIPWLTYDNRQIRGYNAFTDNSGLPAIAVQAGFTKVVYDRTTRGSTEALALNPPSVRREVYLPFSIVFLSRPWSEPTLFEIASGYERARGLRTPPPDFSIELDEKVSNVPIDMAGVRFEIPNRGGSSIQLPESSENALGYLRINSSADTASPSVLATFGVRKNNVLISEAAAQATRPIRSGRIYAEMGGSVTTGIALANPNEFPASVNFYFSDASGDSRIGSLTIPANGQVARFLDQEPFNGASGFQGMFSFTADVPVGVLGLRGLSNERGDFLTSTLPVVDIAARRSSETTLPHFVDGEGWTTEVVLVNPTGRNLPGTIEFSGDVGHFSYSIPAHGNQKFVTAGTSVTKTSGSVRIVSEDGADSPLASAFLSYKQQGITLTQAAVFPITGRSFQMFAESSGPSGAPGSVQSALAIANTSSSPVTVTFELARLDGSPVGSGGSLIIPAWGHVAKFIGELSNLPNPFQGVLRFATTSAEISVTGLRSHYNERGDLLIMTVPPDNENAVHSAGVMLVPHFATGVESSSQVRFFSGGSRSSGTVQFVGQTGELLRLTK